MAITLDGTNGITTTGLTSSGIDDNATSTAVTIDSSGNVLVGGGETSSVVRIPQGDSNINFYSSNLLMGTVGRDTANNDVTIDSAFTGNLTFKTASTERMRLDSGGNLLVGATSTAEITGASVSGAYISGAGNSAFSRGNTLNRAQIAFYNPNGLVGQIGTSGSSTYYNTSSDHRLKENVVNLDNATDRLKQIPVHRFNFIADPNTTVDGFLAHEVQDVVPEAITGAKDAVDDEGNPVYQGIDQSKLVPLLTAALQEAVATIEELKARVAALEAN